MSIANSLITKFRIPTLLGLGIIFLGLASGLYLTLKEQIFLSQAAPNLTPQNITLTNITDDSAAISWQTNLPAASFITFGQNNPGDQTILDDRDTVTPQPHATHYVTLKNLLPKTNYQFKIVSAKFTSDVEKFQTAEPVTNQTGFSPVIGSVLDGDTPVNDGLVYVAIPGAITQSAVIKSGGNFLIPLSYIRKTDLSNIYPLTEEMIGKLSIHSDKGQTNILFKLKADSPPLPTVKLGQSLDLTIPEENPTPSPTNKDIGKYDLDNDGKITAIDYGLLATCIGKKPATILPGGKSCIKADLNGDGTIDQKDLDLISQKLKSFNAHKIVNQ